VSDRFDPVPTALSAVPFAPEIRLYQAPASTGLFDLTGGEYRSDRPPPFWAFAWPGGQALARYLLDHPDAVAGLRVLDIGTGSGLVAIAAAIAGAARVHAADVDPAARASVGRNAAANGVSVTCRADEGVPGDTDVVLAGDVFYSGPVAARMLVVLRRAVRDGARVLVGDPEREYLPRTLFTPLVSYDVPVHPLLEEVTVTRTTVWELRGPAVDAEGGPPTAAEQR
jgi:predicted nicotinamide N-methyase